MIVRLIPRGRFLGGLPRSDTLFGAIAWGIRWTHGEAVLTDLLMCCDRETPAFVLSSSFPYADGSGGRTYYLPKPIHWPQPPVGRDVADLARAKRIRRSAFCSQAVFSAVTSARPVADGHLVCDPSGRFLSIGGEPVPVLRELDIDRNAINRVTGAVQEGRLFFGTETGVSAGGAYFLVRFHDQVSKPYVEAALRFLEDRGLGGDASVGRGQVRIEIEDSSLVPDDRTVARCVTLSLFHPSSQDRQHLMTRSGEAAYRLVKRKGRMESLYAPTAQPWKKTLVMLAEGSVFPRDKDRAVYGSAPVVKEVPFAVRQNGFAYTVGVRDAT